MVEKCHILSTVFSEKWHFSRSVSGYTLVLNLKNKTGGVPTGRHCRELVDSL